MKKTYATILCALMLTGCTKMDLSEEKDTQHKTVQFVMKGLDVDYGETRATLTSEGITDLWVMEGETLLCHQTSTDDSFGAPSISLTIGTHDLTFIASKADGQTFDTQWHCTKVKDTYGALLTYTVTASTSTKQVQLTRVNGKVQWTIEDAIPTNASKLTASCTQCFGLDANLDGNEAATYSASFSISSYAGKEGLTASIMVLPTSHEEGSDTDAAIEIQDASGNSICAYQNTVTVYANQVCNIHGEFFQGNEAAEVSLLSDWGNTTDYAIQ